MRNSTFKRVKRPPLQSTYKGHMKWVIGSLKKLSYLRFRSLHCKKKRAYVKYFSFFFQAVNAPPDTKKKALLQDTPTANVYSQLQKLAGQNPACKFPFRLLFGGLHCCILTFFRHKALEKESFFTNAVLSKNFVIWFVIWK